MSPTDAAELAGRHVVFLSWRDTRNPEGGGAERYLEQMAAGLVERGCRVTIFCVAYAGAAPDETVDGIRFVRRGSKLSVYPLGMWALLRRRLGRVDVVVDVQNGLPFFTPLVTRAPVVVLVHHVHREQWPVVYPGLAGRVGWWIESRLAPRLYRGRQYVAVSRATRAELRELGVTGPRIAVVHNGSDPVVSVDAHKSANPSICVVGRLVPHKQVEHAIDAVGELLEEFPDLRLRVVGSGWWEAELHAHARELVDRGAVVFEGQVSEVRKHEIYEESWLMVLPSLKEGWGLVVGEAAAHRTPTVAYASAGGTRESIVDGVSGVLVDTPAELTAALGALLRDTAGRRVLAEGAVRHGEGYTWEHSQAAFAHVVGSALRGELVNDQDATGD
ncbi:MULTISPECIES: glycosyltransferase family 4 protein [unclassified Nocardioides]|uniref:glycosyltransferase family 4 protein n=1 Tax=unclassified Nocardioides TaxID=2615069 RepID=UPI0009F10175|nr:MULTISPECIES: glycosyltransferase family 4 protein [unclassified Nocardioides]GAW51470.1 group 1 glycosyl transferase [Nocardioides sp. PD653-B2]GAW54096.1 group 1 glycosyl transferase [Nocardioides sp. PD653]